MTTTVDSSSGLIHRAFRFLRKPWPEKKKTFYLRWTSAFPRIPAPVRLRFGVWWLMESDFIGESLLRGGYEVPEANFASNFLKRGMTVVDVGAHRGFFTLLFSKKVGRTGRVLSFEPSKVDRQRLIKHLKINICTNVEVFSCAVGEAEAIADFYAVPTNSVLGSLRPPDTDFEVLKDSVVVKTLDSVLTDCRTQHVDFVKIDVEGGELGVLRGARNLLDRIPRPVILCEVLEMRTQPWGYPAGHIIRDLVEREFHWFQLSEDALLSPLDLASYEFNGNFVAIPKEMLFKFSGLITAVADQSHHA